MSKEYLEGWRVAERACRLIVATSRTPAEAHRRIRRLLRLLKTTLGYN